MASENDRRVALLQDIIKTIKVDEKTWTPLIKASEKYLMSLRTVQMAAVDFYEALVKVSQAAAHPRGTTRDLAAGIASIADVFRSIEGARDMVCKSLQDDLIQPLVAIQASNKSIAQRFEKEYLSEHKRIVTELKKAESESQKAGKKGGEALRLAIANVNDKVKEMEHLRQNKLRDAIVEERKRFCFFIMHFSSVLSHDLNVHEKACSALKQKLPEWTNLAVSPDNLPPDVEGLVTIQQRTFVPIQNSDDVSKFASMYDDDLPDMSTGGTLGRSLSFSGSSDAIPAPSSLPPAALQDNIIRAGDKVKALYDYATSEPDKLSFREGEIINVQEADSSGWSLGTLNGRTGWFPSNYVEKVRTALPPPPPVAAAPPPRAPMMQQQPTMAYSPPTAPQMGYSAPQQQSYAPSPPAKTAKPMPSIPSAAAAAPAPPPPPMASSGGSSGGGGGGRSALLNSIQQGTRLKKAVTNDRSAPLL